MGCAPFWPAPPTRNSSSPTPICWTFPSPTPEQWVWYTAWGLYQNDSGDWVGDLCFKGLPENGQPEIGYGLLPEYEHQGYATEAVRAACRWAFEQPGVTAVEAETDPGNTASQAVLHRVGFVPTGTVGKEGPRFILRQKP